MISRFRDGSLPAAPGRTAVIADEIAALQADVYAAIDAFDITGAVDRIWVLVRALNRHVTEQKPWELAKDEANAARARPGALRSRRRPAGLRRRARRAPAGDRPEDPRGARPAARARLGAGRVRTPAAGRRHRAGAAAFPAHRAPPTPTRRDRHPRAPRRRRRRGSRARARRRGDARRRCRDHDRRRPQVARAAPSSKRASTRASGSIRTRQARRSTSTSCASCSRIRVRSPSARPGSTTSATTRRTTRSSSSSTRNSQLALELGKPVVIHTRAADEDTLARLVEHDGPVILHCFSSQALLEPALERGWYVSFAGNVTYKNAYDLRAAARRVPADRLLAETDSPYLAPQARPRSAERAGVRRPHARRARRGSRRRRRRARARRSTRTQRGCSRL